MQKAEENPVFIAWRGHQGSGDYIPLPMVVDDPPGGSRDPREPRVYKKHIKVLNDCFKAGWQPGDDLETASLAAFNLSLARWLGCSVQVIKATSKMLLEVCGGDQDAIDLCLVHVISGLEEVDPRALGSVAVFTLLSMGKALCERNRAEHFDALSYYERAVRQAEAKANASDYATLLLALVANIEAGRATVFAGRFDKSIQYAQNAETMLGTLTHGPADDWSETRVNASLALASLYEELGKTDDAARVQTAGLEVIKKMDGEDRAVPILHIQALCGMAELQQKRGRDTEARAALRELAGRILKLSEAQPLQQGIAPHLLIPDCIGLLKKGTRKDRAAAKRLQEWSLEQSMDAAAKAGDGNAQGIISRYAQTLAPPPAKEGETATDRQLLCLLNADRETLKRMIRELERNPSASVEDEWEIEDELQFYRCVAALRSVADAMWEHNKFSSGDGVLVIPALRTDDCNALAAVIDGAIVTRLLMHARLPDSAGSMRMIRPFPILGSSSAAVDLVVSVRDEATIAPKHQKQIADAFLLLVEYAKGGMGKKRLYRCDWPKGYDGYLDHLNAGGKAEDYPTCSTYYVSNRSAENCGRAACRGISCRRYMTESDKRDRAQEVAARTATSASVARKRY